MARLVTLIQSFTHRGEGTKENPHRTVEQLWGKDGALIAEYDPCAKTVMEGDAEQTARGMFHGVHENGVI